MSANWDQEKMLQQIDDYFKNTPTEQIVSDLKEAGMEFCEHDGPCDCEVMKLFTLPETVQLFVDLFEGVDKDVITETLYDKEKTKQLFVEKYDIESWRGVMSSRFTLQHAMERFSQLHGFDGVVGVPLFAIEF